MKPTILIAFMGLLITFTSQDVMAQEQRVNNINELDEINRNLERIYQHLDEDSVQATVNTYISTIAIFVSLALVIFGFQLSREGSLSRKSSVYTRVLVLSLVIPVLILIGNAWFELEDFLYPDYLIIISLFLIPCLAVIFLMVTFSPRVKSKTD
jgi:cytochrome bd-type quinol oxidase subunit 2